VNICKGDFIEWDAPQFEGGGFFRGRKTGKTRVVGTKRLTGVVERDSYGQKTGQHTFTIRLADGKLKRVMGRNLYPHVIAHVPAGDHDEQASRKEARKTDNEQLRTIYCA